MNNNQINPIDYSKNPRGSTHPAYGGGGYNMYSNFNMTKNYDPFDANAKGNVNVNNGQAHGHAHGHSDGCCCCCQII